MATADDGQSSGPERWLSILGRVIPALAIAAAAWYALLTFSYDQFYRRLAVNLSDVGLSYSAILANSVGTGMAMLLLVLLLSSPILGLRLLRRHEQWSQESYRRFARRVLGFALAACFVVALIGLPMLSSAGFDRVRQGKAVLPPRLPLANFALLPIHADPVSLVPKGSDGGPPAGVEGSEDSAQRARLLYLGQANGELVLYDSSEQQVVFVPSSDVVVRITNCHIRRPPKPVCAEARSVIWPFSVWQHP